MSKLGGSVGPLRNKSWTGIRKKSQIRFREDRARYATQINTLDGRQKDTLEIQKRRVGETEELQLWT